MKPKFKNTLAWEQAQLLMQPAFIRVMDNLRKEIEQCSWKATYQEIVDPYPGYLLCLTLREVSVNVDIWDLCFQVCFVDYHQDLQYANSNQHLEDYIEVEIDTSLIDETGDVDWQALETKAQKVVRQVFASLPNE